jgi:ubiquinone/menaquinone biosynthesis C-methylase UbiE
MKKFYEKHILPYLVHKVCGIEPINHQRQKIVPLASGKVLEIGFGSGHNLPFYNKEKVSHLYALEPSEEMLKLAEPGLRQISFPYQILQTSAESIPLEYASIDTIVMTYSLCTISDPEKALQEMHRVLTPEGRLLFLEHGKAPEKSVEWWQNCVTPIWKHFSGGCHLNRDIPQLLQSAGLVIIDLDSDYIPGWKPATFNYWGTAKKR